MFFFGISLYKKHKARQLSNRTKLILIKSYKFFKIRTIINNQSYTKDFILLKSVLIMSIFQVATTLAVIMLNGTTTRILKKWGI